jgi:aminoglycoside phosphotransferase (APT) family kinase protein
MTPDFDPARLEPLFGGPVRLVAAGGDGQSNPTWFVHTADQQVVLRKKPAGQIARGAHAVEREYRIMAALAKTPVPVPRMILLEPDPAVIGTPFYLMARLAGNVDTQTGLPAVSPADRRSLHLAAARILGQLHALDWRALGLADFGRPADYYARQMHRWRGQLDTLGQTAAGPLHELADWFAANGPAENSATLVHGDYRIGNLIHDGGAITGVLDWELSTLGDPLSDLAHWSMFYDLRPDQMGGIAGLNPVALGIPSRQEFLEVYRAAGGCSAPLCRFHRAFAMFRMSVILEGITAREQAGQSTSENAHAIGALAPDFAQLARDILSGPEDAGA